ncbi:hypothetical protein [Propionibacterium freudenreichii]|uniref:hypothetical protein n=1 Tax=Propionibacterium freudenreichii TaxID=1744 RepID=UPI0021A3A025|nr:hypothetical protein [Propionibacterium freudenreichii]
MTTSSEDLSSQGPARMVPEQSTTALVARALRRPKVVGVVLLAAEVVLRLASLLGGRGGNADYHDVDGDVKASKQHGARRRAVERMPRWA